MQMKAFLWLYTLVFLLTACGATGMTHIQQDKLLQLITSNQAPVVIDVRSRMEYDSGHVPNAIHIPFWSAVSPQELVNNNSRDLLVIYCQHGPRAGVAKLFLTFSGFENIVYLEGHMSSWQKAKLPTVTADKIEN